MTASPTPTPTNVGDTNPPTLPPGECYETVTVGGAEAVQASSMGTYAKVASLKQGDRPVYERLGTLLKYLYYWPGTRNWLIGSDYTVGTCLVSSSGGAGALCPDNAVGWQVYSGGSLVSTYPITVVRPGAPELPRLCSCRVLA